MANGTATDGFSAFTSWKEVASYLGRGVRTVQRWEAKFGLPVQRPAIRSKGMIRASREELDRWIVARWASRSTLLQASAIFLGTQGDGNVPRAAYEFIRNNVELALSLSQLVLEGLIDDEQKRKITGKIRVSYDAFLRFQRQLELPPNLDLVLHEKLRELSTNLERLERSEYLANVLASNVVQDGESGSRS